MNRTCSFGSSLERTEELGRERRGAVLFHAAQRHAHMLGIEHHRDAFRLQDLVDRGRDLRGQMLLRLQAARIDIDQPRELGQADHALHRPIGDMRLADRTASCGARNAS